MNNPTYRERVQAIAKEISEKNNNKKWGPGLPDWNKSMEAGHIAIKHMADIVRHVLKFNHTQDYIKSWLEDLGLIPDSGQPPVLPMQLGDRGYGGYDLDNPPPESEGEGELPVCEECKKRPATHKYSNLNMCSRCCDKLNDYFDEEYR